ncbi:MAG: hypothetical protein WAU00_09890 [Caldilinea sp.]
MSHDGSSNRKSRQNAGSFWVIVLPLRIFVEFGRAWLKIEKFDLTGIRMVRLPAPETGGQLFLQPGGLSAVPGV